MNILKVIGIITITGIAGFFSGYIYQKYTAKPEIQVVYKTEIKYKTIERDYAKMTKYDVMDKLKCYDFSKPILDGTFVNPGVFRVGAGLCERKWERDFEMKISSTRGNWKFYAVFAGLGAIGGGYFIYKLGK